MLYVEKKIYDTCTESSKMLFYFHILLTFYAFHTLDFNENSNTRLFIDAYYYKVRGYTAKKCSKMHNNRIKNFYATQ